MKLYKKQNRTSKFFRTLLYAFSALLLFSCINNVSNGSAQNTSSPSSEPSSEPSPSPTPSPSENGLYYTLPVIQTTDLHGHIVELEDKYTNDFTESENVSSNITDTATVQNVTTGTNDSSLNNSLTVHYKLAYIADKANDIRGHGSLCDTKKLLLLDGGDIYQGASVSNFLNGEPVYIAYDKMKYDAVALGNHEFDWGIENLIEFDDGTLPAYKLNGTPYPNDVPVLCTNLYQNGKKVSFTHSNRIFEKTAYNSAGDAVSVKIAVIGFVENWAHSIMKSQFIDKGYSIDENYTEINELATELEENGSCDATILLVHGDSIEVSKKIIENSAETAIDLVLGGHTHQKNVNGKQTNLPYLQGEAYGNGYAYAELAFSLDENGKIKFQNVQNPQIITVDSQKNIRSSENENAGDLDEEIISITNEAVSQIDDKLEIIGYITESASSYKIKGSGDKASNMGNWMCDIIRRIRTNPETESDIAFVNSGGIRTYFQIEKGAQKRNIRVSDIYEIFPFSNKIYTYEITYEELLKVFEYALSSAGLSQLSFVTGIDCNFSITKVPTASGKTYDRYNLISLVKNDGENDVVIYKVENGGTIYSGEWIDGWKDKKITVSVSDFIATNERTNSYSPKNPFIAWNGTDKCIESSLIDNENAVKILQNEAKQNGGLLKIDTKAHFILNE